jgi:hypothetical protein
MKKRANKVTIKKVGALKCGINLLLPLLLPLTIPLLHNPTTAQSCNEVTVAHIYIYIYTSLPKKKNSIAVMKKSMPDSSVNSKVANK